MIGFQPLEAQKGNFLHPKNYLAHMNIANIYIPTSYH